MAGGDVATVFLETNLGTRITVSFPASSTTIADLKQRVSHEHAASFPQFGQISVQSIKVEHGGSGHKLADSMAVRDAFHGVNGAWRLQVDALPRPQHPDQGMVTERQSGGGANSDDSSADHYEPVSGRHGFEGSSSGSFVDANRLRDLQAFDDTKAGAKGLVDAGVRHVPAIFHHHSDALAPYAVSTHVAIPVIDLSGSRAEVVAAVKEAAETVGLFQVVKHGVPEAAMTGMLAAVRRFHEEPVEAKAPYYTRDASRSVRYNCNTDLFRSPAARWRDTLYLDEPDKAAAEGLLPRACCGVAPEYARLMRRLGHSLFELLSEALGVRRGHLEEQAGCMEAVTIFAHYYPACPEPHLTLGAGRHSDPSFATVLLQDQVGGLQVLAEEEEEGGPAWVDVPVVPGALVVTVGDFLQLVSNGRFHNVLHRVVAKDVGPRISVACFFRANDATVCAPVVVGSDPARYRTVTAEELLGSSRAQNRLRDLRI